MTFDCFILTLICFVSAVVLVTLFVALKANVANDTRDITGKMRQVSECA